MFSGEKIVNGDGQVNLKNDVIDAENRYEANINGGVIPTKVNPCQVMICCGLIYNGPTSVVVLPAKTRFNSDFYTSKVLPVIRRDGERLLGNDLTFQQDGGGCHTSAQSMEALREVVHSVIERHHWPANSSDLNPLDYFFWNELAKLLNEKQYKKRTDLIRNIRRIVKQIPLKMVRDVIDKCRSRIYVMVKNQGGLIIKGFK